MCPASAEAATVIALAGPWQGTPVRAVDPDGSIAQLLPIDRIIGSVVYPAAELVEPGVVQVIEGRGQLGVHLLTCPSCPSTPSPG